MGAEGQKTFCPSPMAARKRKKAPGAPRTTEDISAGIQPTTRVFTTWTPQMILQAERRADVGDLRLAANLCDWLLGDDRIAGLLHTRVQSLLGLEPIFEASGDKRRSNRAVRALEADEDWWASYPETELAQLLTWGLLLGVAPARHRWTADADHGGRFLARPEFWHPQHIRWDPMLRTWIAKVETDKGTTGVGVDTELIPGDGAWILHTPYGPNRPWSMGLWRGLARWALLKSYAIGDIAKHSEKGSILVGTSQANANVADSKPEQRADLAEQLYARARESVCVLPKGFDLKLVECKGDPAIYVQQIAMANEAFAISIRGGNLTTEVTGGSLAAAEVQERLGDDAKQRFDAQSITTTIHDQSLVWWASFNFGDPNLAPWPVYPVKQPTDLQKKAEGLGFAVDMAYKLIGLGYELDREAFASVWEISDFAIPNASPNPGLAGAEPLLPPVEAATLAIAKETAQQKSTAKPVKPKAPKTAIE